MIDLIIYKLMLIAMQKNGKYVLEDFIKGRKGLRFSIFFLWLQAVQIYPHFFYVTKVRILF
jgi:hypothetical protein